MKRQTIKALCGIVCCAGLTGITTTRASAPKDAIELNDAVLRLIDGIPAMNNAMVRFVITTAKLKHLQQGKGTEHQGTLAYAGGLYTLDQLAVMEKEAMDQHGKSYTARWTENPFNNVLEDVKQQIKKIVDEYKKELTLYRDAVVLLIHRWAGYRNKTETPLLAWGRAGGNADTFIERNFTSLYAVNLFIDDLLLIIADVKKTCAHSGAYADATIAKIKNPKK